MTWSGEEAIDFAQNYINFMDYTRSVGHTFIQKAGYYDTTRPHYLVFNTYNESNIHKGLNSQTMSAKQFATMNTVIGVSRKPLVVDHAVFAMIFRNLLATIDHYKNQLAQSIVQNNMYGRYKPFVQQAATTLENEYYTDQLSKKDSEILKLKRENQKLQAQLDSLNQSINNNLKDFYGEQNG